MASGLIHTKSVLCASSIGVAYYGLDEPLKASAWLLAGLYCTVVQPDLDVDGGFYGLHVLDKTRQGLGIMWQAYWSPYSRLLSHRSFWSHFPVVGTLIRLLYVGFWFVPLLVKWETGADFLTAIIAMDFLHFALDWKVFTWIGLFRQKG